MNPRLTLNADGIVTEEEWYLEGKPHRVDGPAYRAWTIVEGMRILTREQWWLQGQRHWVDGPAHRTWEVVNGVRVLTCECWWLKGKLHRLNGAAFRCWRCVNGRPVLTEEVWWLHDQRHRLDGPALRTWGISGLIAEEEWWLYGKEVDRATLHRAVSTITLWLRYQTQRRERVISSLLATDGMTVFPGLMGLLRLH